MTTTMSSSCPFCGDSDPCIDEVEIGIHAVVCNDCGCIGPIERLNDGTVQSAGRAIELWNKRGGKPCPDCGSVETSVAGPVNVQNIETYHRLCDDCGHAWGAQ